MVSCLAISLSDKLPRTEASKTELSKVEFTTAELYKGVLSRTEFSRS